MVTLIGAPSTQPETELAFTVARNGEPVEDLEPYLGAGGHLVAIRGGDLAYTHLHAEALTGDATLRFTGGLPGAGSYRMFLQFRHGGEVRTAAITVQAEQQGSRSRPTS